MVADAANTLKVAVMDAKNSIRMAMASSRMAMEEANSLRKAMDSLKMQLQNIASGWLWIAKNRQQMGQCELHSCSHG